MNQEREGKLRRLRVALIGCGEIAYHATGKALKAAEGVELVLAMDIDAVLARSFGDAFGVPHTTSLGAVLEDPTIDAVLISTPHFEHEPLTVRAAEAGKHVMCEKPIACSLEQADRMIRACDDAGVALGINMIARYEPIAMEARRLVASGAIGEILGLNVHFTIRKPDGYWDGGFTGRSISPWRRRWMTSGGGVLMINMIHELDRMLFVTGLDVLSASAEFGTLATDIEVEDTGCVTYRFSNGALGTMTASSCAPGDRRFGVQVIGTEGQMTFGSFAAGLMRSAVKSKGYSYHLRRVLPAGLVARLNRNKLSVFTVNEIEGLQRNRWTTARVPEYVDPRRRYIESFAASVRSGRAPEIGGLEGRRVLAAILAAYESGRTGVRVSVRPAGGENRPSAPDRFAGTALGRLPGEASHVLGEQAA